MIISGRIVAVAARYGRGPSALASLLSVLSFDFFFVTPYLTFAVSDTEYVITFSVMLLVALTISRMTVRIKEQAEAARERERRAASSYETATSSPTAAAWMRSRTSPFATLATLSTARR